MSIRKMRVYEVELYHPVGLLRRKVFYVFANNYDDAMDRVIKRWPNAEPLSVCCLGNRKATWLR
ncbi:hypothetical protein SAMN05216326_12556 [Nitrosomonas marina]|uniref:Uncharacterized protein n=1 Tax=Nitrosomonas marina TaxID=917 RepID=A0A1I0EA14_9PROT|nr:hypothetical protein [Nitrosomonas marina]SET41206.1 hypothetical protein SAMN05216326_12556 [Nitrosomonas marina]